MLQSMKLLDLFCGAGGAGYGYYLAGFQVTGVDLSPQPRYPFRFVQGDALEYAQLHGHEYDVIHASPPCQHFTALKSVSGGSPESAWLLPATRELLKSLGVPYVLENVPGAPMESPMLLCGKMFGLQALRHRLFDSSHFMLAPSHRAHVDFLPFRNVLDREYRSAIDVFWMTNMQTRQAIPPAYTEFIGRQLVAQLAGSV